MKVFRFTINNFNRNQKQPTTVRIMSMYEKIGNAIWGRHYLALFGCLTKFLIYYNIRNALIYLVFGGKSLYGLH